MEAEKITEPPHPTQPDYGTVFNDAVKLVTGLIVLGVFFTWLASTILVTKAEIAEVIRMRQVAISELEARQEIIHTKMQQDVTALSKSVRYVCYKMKGTKDDCEGRD